MHNMEIKLCEKSSLELENLINGAMTSLYYKPESKINRTDVIENGLEKMVARKEVFVAEIDNLLVGCVSCKKIDDVVLIGMLCVTDNLRNKGIGTALMKFIENMYLSQSGGLVKFELDIFYHKLAFFDKLLNWYLKLGYNVSRRLNCYESEIVRQEMNCVLNFEQFSGMEYREVVDRVYRFPYENIVMEKLVQT